MRSSRPSGLLAFRILMNTTDRENYSRSASQCLLHLQPYPAPVYGMHTSRLLLILLIVLLLLPAADGAAYFAPTTTATTSPPVRIVTIAMPTTTAAPDINGLSVESTPEGAVVIVDGINWGKTPVTVRPLATGPHSVIVTLDGYGDVAERVVIPVVRGGTVVHLSYTLVPVTTPPTVVRTTTPATTRTTSVPVRVVTTAAVPAQRVPVQNLTEEFRLPQPISIQPVTVSVGGRNKTVHFSTLSPYFRYQLAAAPGAYLPPDILSMPTAYVEVDQYNVYLPGSHLMSSVEMALDPVWGDADTVYIATTDKFYNNTNFRWISAGQGVTGFYQVSRTPFDDNASRWQNQYVPGLVCSGPVKELHVDGDGFHYFSLNFAPIANHNPSDPPFYTGVIRLDETLPGRGTAMNVFKIPVINLGIWTKKSSAGPLGLSIPAGFSFIPASELTEAELGNPNGNIMLSDPERSLVRTSTFAESAIANLPKTYYVRVVPIRADGSAGIPTIPVTVTVVRPQPCPPNPPADVVKEITIKPPSGTVASFYMTSFVPDWIHTDQNGELVSRAHFVTVSPNPACSAAATGNQMIDNLNAQSCAQYGGTEPGYHFYADPAETHWYDTVWDIITGLFGAFTQVINAVSSAWEQIKAAAIQIAAHAVTALTAGMFDCSSSPACVGVLNAGLAIAMSALGVPPTIPNVADLQNMGADYMAKVAAEELGAGGVLDTAEAVYDSLPDDAQQAIKDNAEEVGSGIADSVVSQSGAATSAAAGGSFYIPDPLYYEAHPAMAMVKVYNPNSVRSDPVEMFVRDSAGLFKPSETFYVPALAPGDSTVIPVILEEDYTKVYTSSCNAQAYTTTCGDICVPCYWNLWYFALIDNAKSGGDTFSVSFSSKKDGYFTGGLTPSSSGKVLTSQDIIAFDEQGKACGAYNAKTVLAYPSGWQMQTNGLNRNLQDLCWLKYSFTEGAKGRLIG